MYMFIKYTLLYNPLFFNRCSVFLIDKETKELVAEVFDGISTNNKEVPLKLFIYFSPNQLRTVKPN